MTLWWSSRGSWGTDLRGYLGERESWRVLGRWNVVVVLTLRAFLLLTCFANALDDERDCRSEICYEAGKAYAFGYSFGSCAGLRIVFATDRR